MEERLQKVMAQAGVGSRRACEELIRANRVRVNGKVATLGQKVHPKRDSIVVDGIPLGAQEPKRYLILHKPFGYITTVKDQFDRKNILDLLPQIQERIYPVGRLDYDSDGLVFLTNDGELAHKVMHPRFELPKTYLVQVKGKITMDAVYRLRRGIMLEDGPTAPAQVSVIKSSQEKSTITLTLIEGRNRQVRRMCQRVGFPVESLTRTAIGPLNLGKLAPGEHRFLSTQELKDLQRAVDVHA